MLRNIIFKLFILLATTNLVGQKTKINYFKNKQISYQRWYGTDNLKDSVKVFYKTGALDEVFYYDDKERFHGRCLKYTNDGKVMTEWTFHHGKLIYRKDLNLVFTSKNKKYILQNVANVNKINSLIIENPRNQKLYYSRASYRSRLNNLILAENDLIRFKEILQQNTSNQSDYSRRTSLSNCYDKLASVYSKLGHKELSLYYHFEAYLQLPVNGRLNYNLGANFSFYEYPDLALHYLYKTTAQSPKHTFANWGLAITHLNLKNYSKALNHINVCFNNEETLHKLTTGASDKGIRATKGVISYHLKEYKQARKNLCDAVKIKKDNSYAMFYLSKLYQEKGNKLKAKKWLKKAEENGYSKIHGSSTATNNNKITLTSNIITNTNQTAIILKNYRDTNFLYTIHDLKGNLITSSTSNLSKINVASLQNGLYKLNIKDNNNSSSLPFIIDIQDQQLLKTLRTEKRKHKKRKKQK